MPTKYKLLKDLPDAQAGTIYEEDRNGWYRPLNDSNIQRTWHPAHVKESEWFEPIPDRIVISDLRLNIKPNGRNDRYYQFNASRCLEESSNTAIIAAIESIVNNDPQDKKYSEMDVISAWENGFLNAKRMFVDKVSRDAMIESGHDYIKSIQQKQ